MQLKVGVGVATINPELPVRLAGYGARKGAADSQHDDLTVRVLIMADPAGAGATGDHAVCIATYDLLSMRHDFAEPLRAALAEELGIPVGRVLTHCVHTHGAPSCLAGAEVLGWHVQPGYFERLVDGTRKAAAAARADLRDAEVRHSRFSLPEGTGSNRRRRPWDPSASAVQFVDGSGNPLVTIGAFGLHPVVHGPAHEVVNTDWVGPFRTAIEDAVGGTALFIQGCEGDVNPATTAWDGDAATALAAAADLGQRLADAVVTACTGATDVTGSGVRAWCRSMSLPLGRTMYTVLSKLQGRLDVDLVEFALGDLHLVGVPGEGTQEFQKTIEDARDHPVVFVGLAPSAHGYFPSPFRFGYEEAMSLGRQATRVLEATLAAGPEVPITHPAAAPAEEARVRRVDTAAGLIEFAELGDREAPAVLIIHGMPGSWRQGLGFGRDLAEVNRVIIPSRPGYGRTPIETGRTPAQQAAAYAAILDVLGIERAAVIGASGGGPSAAAFAQHHPDRCAGLVLVCALAPHLIPVPRPMLVTRWLPVVPEALGAVGRWRGRRDILDDAKVDAAVAKELTETERSWLERDPSIRDRMLAHFRSHLDAPQGMAGFRNDIDQVRYARVDGPPATDRITAPTMVLHGGDDPVVPVAHGRFWADAIPGASLQVIPGGGHYFFLTRHEVVLPTISSGLLTVFGENR